MPLALLAAAAAAAALPSLLAYNPPPSPTFLNQAAALAAWGVFAALAAGPLRAARAAAPLFAALALVAGAALASGTLGALPSTIMLSALGTLAAAAVMVAAGASGGDAATREARWAAFCTGWAIAGGVNVAIAAAQVFVPGVIDGDWIARSGLTGRAVGNLRQPNHLSSLLLWAAVATAALLQLGRLRPWAARALFAALLAAVVMTASRTGALSVLLLAGWGALDRTLHRRVRLLLLAAPLLYALAWGGLWLWAQAGDGVFGGQARLQEADLSSSRFAIWRNTLAMIAAQPWTGTGFGGFNLAWTLTPFPDRPTAFFDHAHNLPLQFAAELGLPLAAAVLGLLAWALLRAWRRGADDAGARGAAVFVGLIGVHSLLEYPLWYAHFLLPAAWAWGHALGVPQASPASAAQRARWAAVAGAAMVAGSALAVADYARVNAVFEVRAGAAPLAARIADGRRSVLFGHHADYAAVTTGLARPDDLAAFDRTKFHLLDTRLMQEWAEALAAAGDREAASHVAARLREFGAARAPEFFAPCASPASAADSWACTPPATPTPWRVLAQPAGSASSATQ